MFATNFTTIDWAIVVAFLVATLVIGLLANRYIHTVSGYMVGGRSAGTSLNVATYIGTGLGLVTLMYAGIDAFSRGFAYVSLSLLGLAIGVLLGSSGFVIHRLRRMKLTTLPEFFERRFSRGTRITAGLICALAGILNMGLFPKMGATFLTYTTGLGAAGGDPTVVVNVITSLLIVIALAYTVLGGMVAVIVTDYLQFVVLSVGMALGIWFCLTYPGLDWTSITAAQATHRGAAAFNPFHADSYGWTYMIWMALVFFSAALCWTPEATRALTSRDARATMRTFLFASPGQFVRLAVPALWAVAAFAYVSQRPELTAYFFPEGLAGPPDAAHAAKAMPLLIGKVVPTGLLGVLTAGLVAAFMSTHDSYLLGWASIITRDVVCPLAGRPVTARAQIRVTRVTVVAIGAFLLLWGIWYELPASVWTYMAVTGNVYLSGSVVALVGGMYWRRASSAGAMAALLGGLVSLSGLWGATLDGWVPGLAAIVGVGNYVFCAVLFVVFSLLLPDGTGAGEEAA